MSVAVIELAIGMAFVLLLASLLVSAFTEIVASWARWRSGNLWKGLRGMLGPDVQRQLYAHPLVRTMVTPTTGPPIGLGWLLRMPGVRRLWPQAKGPSYIPARTFAFALLDLIEQPYRTLEGLTARVDEALADAARMPALAKALEALQDAGPLLAVMSPVVQPLLADLDSGAPERVRPALVRLRAEIVRLMKAPGLAGADLDDALRPMLRAAGNDVDRLRGEVETWFDAVMDRVSGWYKRKTQAVQFAAGLALAIALDLDAILVARVLWSDSTLRSAVVAEAETFARNPPPRLAEPSATPAAADAPVVRLSAARVAGSTTTSTVLVTGNPDAEFERINQRIASLGLPLRGSCEAVAGKPTSWWCAAQIRSTKQVAVAYVGTIDVQTDPLRWLGWLLTALATTMGAPFWFDLLKRFVNVRSAVATGARDSRDASKQKSS